MREMSDLEDGKVRKKCPCCDRWFTCDASCGNADRGCWCPECFKKLLEKVSEEEIYVYSLLDRFSCSVISQEDKEKLLLAYLTGKVVMVREDGEK